MFWRLVNIVHLFSVVGIGLVVESSAENSWMRDNRNGALIMATWCAIGVLVRLMADRESGETPSYLWYVLLVGFGIFFIIFGLSGELP
jgi:hypothetical protein